MGNKRYKERHILPYLAPPKMQIHKVALGSNQHCGLGSKYPGLPTRLSNLEREASDLLGVLFASLPTTSLPLSDARCALVDKMNSPNCMVGKESGMSSFFVFTLSY